MNELKQNETARASERRPKTEAGRIERSDVLHPEALAISMLRNLEAAQGNFDGVLEQGLRTIDRSAEEMGLGEVEAAVAVEEGRKRLEEIRDKLLQLIADTKQRVHEVTSETMTQDAIDAYIQQHSEIEADAESMAADADALAKLGELFVTDKLRAMAISIKMYENAQETDSKKIVEARGDSGRVSRTLENFAQAMAYDDIDMQFALMQVVFARDPEGYVAAMEQLTYRLKAEASREHTDHKIEHIFGGVRTALEARGVTSPEQVDDAREAFERLKLAIESQIVGQVLDTHATNLDSLVSLIGVGQLETAHARRAKGEAIKSTKGDDFKLAGSESVFTYLGGYHAVERDVFLEVDSDWLDQQEGSFYTSEDYVLKPPKNLKAAEKQPRKSFREKIADVMSRKHVKEYLASKITAFIMEKAVKNGVSLDDLRKLNVGVGNILEYFSENSDIQGLPMNLLGGRPEGHIPVPVPLDKCRAKLPNESLGNTVAELKKKLADAQKKGRPEEISRVESTLARFEDLAREHGLEVSMRDVVAGSIDKKIADLKAQLAATGEDPELTEKIRVLSAFRANLLEYDASDKTARSHKDKVYVQNLGYNFPPGLEAATYGKLNFVQEGDLLLVHSGMGDPEFPKALAAALAMQGMDIETRGRGVAIRSGDHKGVSEATYRFMEQYVPSKLGLEKVLRKNVTGLDLYQVGYSREEIERITKEKSESAAMLVRLMESGQLGYVANGERLSDELAKLIEKAAMALKTDKKHQEAVIAILMTLMTPDRGQELLGRPLDKLRKAMDVFKQAELEPLDQAGIENLMKKMVGSMEGPNYAARLKDAGLERFMPLIGQLKGGKLKTKEDLMKAARAVKGVSELTEAVKTDLAAAFELTD